MLSSLFFIKLQKTNSSVTSFSLNASHGWAESQSHVIFDLQTAIQGTKKKKSKELIFLTLVVTLTSQAGTIFVSYLPHSVYNQRATYSNCFFLSSFFYYQISKFILWFISYCNNHPFPICLAQLHFIFYLVDRVFFLKEKKSYLRNVIKILCSLSGICSSFNNNIC